jgi:hypothetical protein
MRSGAGAFKHTGPLNHTRWRIARHQDARFCRSTDGPYSTGTGCILERTDTISSAANLRFCFLPAALVLQENVRRRARGLESARHTVRHSDSGDHGRHIWAGPRLPEPVLLEPRRSSPCTPKSCVSGGRREAGHARPAHFVVRQALLRDAAADILEEQRVVGSDHGPGLKVR